MESRVLQVETGVVETFDWDAVKIVVSEGYPTWTWVLKALSGSQLITCVRGIGIQERLDLNNLGLPGRIISWNTIQKHLEGTETEQEIWVWMQGFMEFMIDS